MLHIRVSDYIWLPPVYGWVGRGHIALLIGGGAMMACSFAAEAQQKAMPVIGFFGTASPASLVPFEAAFREGLSETGYVEGQNVAIEFCSAEDDYDRLPALATDLVSRKVDVILAGGDPASALATKNVTSTIPIVFTSVVDPVGVGLAASFNRPGGNATGVNSLTVELMPKQFELLSALVPAARMIGLLVNPKSPTAERIIGDVEEAARAKGVQLQILKAADESEIESAFVTIAQMQVGALMVADTFFANQRKQLVALAAHQEVPAIYDGRYFVELGGLISYGASSLAAYRQAGTYAGRILKGEKPSDLPIQQPAKVELVINVRAATALGLTIPESLFARVDEVIDAKAPSASEQTLTDPTKQMGR